MLTKQMCIKCHRPPSNWEQISNLCLTHTHTLCILIKFIINGKPFAILQFLFSAGLLIKTIQNNSYNVLSPLTLTMIEAPKTRFKQQSSCNSQQPLHHAFHR